MIVTNYPIKESLQHKQVKFRVKDYKENELVLAL